MVDHAKDSGSFTITDLGRIAAKYYIHHKSIEIFNRVLGTRMTEEGVLSMISLSTEASDFGQTLHGCMNDSQNDRSLIRSRFGITRQKSLLPYLIRRRMRWK